MTKKYKRRYNSGISRDVREYLDYSKARWSIEVGQEKHDVQMSVLRETRANRVQFEKDRYELKRSRGEVRLQMQRQQLEDMKSTTRHNRRKELMEYRNSFIDAGHPFPDGADSAVIDDWWIDCLRFSGFSESEIIEQFPQFV